MCIPWIWFAINPFRNRKNFSDPKLRLTFKIDILAPVIARSMLQQGFTTSICFIAYKFCLIFKRTTDYFLWLPEILLNSMPFLSRGDRTKNNRTLSTQALLDGIHKIYKMGRDTISGKEQKRRGYWKFLKEKKVILSKKKKKWNEKNFFSKILKDNVLDLLITFNSIQNKIWGKKQFIYVSMFLCSFTWSIVNFLRGERLVRFEKGE